ncbi:UNKNOWN [Stylonychia lemnae]|uniref:Uncharacterized protein n=1 Tax=Stylonychia lemnae TaxID=5949 RepID=A0A078AWN7_STYLE|nr:UNKNOWN [Stylonychia lemnae]|eukprot:CDW86574.1 UNKNOWN [Stylonychia lemnae]
MLKTTLTLAIVATAVLADSNVFTLEFERENEGPTINLPDSFTMETALYIESENGSWTDPKTHVVWYCDGEGDRFKVEHKHPETGKVLQTIFTDFKKKVELTHIAESNKCTKKETTGLNLKRFLKQIFHKDSPMFEYVGFVIPEFDKLDKYHAFVTKEEGVPVHQRATQFYFDSTGVSNWVKFYKPENQSELHNIMAVKEHKFQDSCFAMDNCHENIAQSYIEEYLKSPEQYKAYF